MEQWAAAEVGSAELGDPRRTKRLITVLEDLAAQPSASVPQACEGNWAAIKGAYRFFDSAAVTPAAIRAAQQAATIERSRAHSLLLAIQDTTEFNLTAHPATTGLGSLAGPGQRGILVHSTLAVSPAGVPLGLLQQESWTRDPEQAGSRHARRTEATSDKESGRWLRAQEETLADAIGLVEAYTLRWLIERYHSVLKSGCQVEQLQLETAERLERALATSCVVAWRLLWLTYRARRAPESSGWAVLTPAEQAVVAAKMTQLPPDPTLREVVRAIAKLGGFIGRTGDGEPGVKAHTVEQLVVEAEGTHQGCTYRTTGRSIPTPIRRGPGGEGTRRASTGFPPQNSLDRSVRCPSGRDLS